MTAIQLTYGLYHKYYTDKHISVIGTAFLDDQLLREKTLARYFTACSDPSSFKDHLEKLSGQFSVIIDLERSVLIAVDVIRTFPLFIYQKDQDIIISNEIRGGSSRNEEEIAYFKEVFCTLGNDTLLKDWQQLQAGEYAILDKSAFTIEIREYEHHSSKLILKGDETDLIRKVAEEEQSMIHKAIQYANGRRILVPLSGGYDSRYLLTLLKENNYPSVECFTYGKKDSFEVLIARNVAEKLNIKWTFIEYTDDLLNAFFREKWQAYSDANHHFSSLPHEQDFFALLYLKEEGLLPENAVVMNGFCQDILAGSFKEPIKNFDLPKYIYLKFGLKPDLSAFENSWNGYQEWLVKNRLSKFIVNSVRVYEYFGLDFYLPFWNKDWIHFWYALVPELRLHQRFYTDYLFKGHFKTHHIGFKKPGFDSTNALYALKKIAKTILPGRITRKIREQNSRNEHMDTNNTLYLYEAIYRQLSDRPAAKDFRINNIHALYFLKNLKEKHQL